MPKLMKLQGAIEAFEIFSVKQGEEETVIKFIPDHQPQIDGENVYPVIKKTISQLYEMGVKTGEEVILTVYCDIWYRRHGFVFVVQMQKNDTILYEWL